MADDESEPDQTPSPSESGQVVLQRAEFSGPLPPPRVLEGYDQLVPGAAERLLGWAETEARHIRELQQKAQDAEIEDLREERRERRRGQTFGLTIGLVTILSGVGLTVAGYPVPGSVLSGTAFVALVAVFVLGRYFEAKESE